MTYEEIVSNEHLAEEILNECYFSADRPVEKWEAARKFISEVITNSGTFLDVGCANGFLIKSLQSWSGHNLVPYGIDILEKNINNAKELFPEYEKNFVALPFESFLTNYPQSLPKEFNYLCWSFWDDNHLITITEIDYLLSHVKNNGKIIITFYPDDSIEPTDIIGNIPNLLQMGYKAVHLRNMVPERNEQLVYITK